MFSKRYWNWNSVSDLIFHLFLALVLGIIVTNDNVGASTKTMCKELFPQRVESDKTPCVDVSLLGAGLPQSILIMITINKDLPNGCERLNGNVTIAIQMINQLGYPVGFTEVGKTFMDFASGLIYCTPPKDQKYWMIPTRSSQVQCYFQEEAKDKYIQPDVSKTAVPSLIHFDVTSTISKQIYLAWTYLGVMGALYKGSFPDAVWVVGEAYEKETQKVFSFMSNEKAKLFARDDYSQKAECDKTENVKIIDERPAHSTSSEYMKAYCKTHSTDCETIITTTTTTTTTPLPPPVVKPGHTPEPPSPLIVIGGQPPAIIPPAKRKQMRPTNIYDGCVSKTKGCIVPPLGSQPRECLKTQTCSLVLAFQRQDTEVNSNEVVVVEMYHSDPGEWFAMGVNFNSDEPGMGNTYVMECVDEGLLDGPVIYNSYNTRGKYENVRFPEDSPQGAEKIIKKQEAYRKNREIYCRFTIKVTFSRTPPGSSGEGPKLIDLNKQPVFIVAAWGHQQIAGGDGNLLKHRPGHYLKTGKKSLLAARYAPSASQKVFLQVHGALMTWASLFCFPVGILIGRFWKETFPQVKICRKVPLWLFLHVILMTTAVLLVIASMVSEMLGHLHWKSFRGSKVHTFVGGASGGILLLNFIFGFFVKETYHKGLINVRGILHSAMGHLVQVGFAVILLLTDQVPFGGVPCTVKWVVCASAFSSIVAHILMTYHYCWVDWIVGLRRGRSYGVRPIGVLTEGDVNELMKSRPSRMDLTRESLTNQDNIISAPGTRLRVGGVILLFMVSCMYSGWITVMIFMNKKGPCNPLDQYEDE